MKKEILMTVNSFVRRTFVRTLVVGVLAVTCFPIATNAQKFSFEKNSPEIKYLGTVQDKLVFQVDLKNVQDNTLYVTVKDDEGNVLFAEKVKDNKFSRKFAFDRAEFDGRKVAFFIQGANDKTAQAYQIATSTRLVEDVVVTRL